MSDRVLTWVIAGVLVVSAAVVYFGFKVSANQFVTIGAGVVSGVLLTSTSLNGPPLAVVMHAQRISPRAMRATLAAIFVIHGVIGATLFAATGEMTSTAIQVIPVAIPALAVGWVLGDRLSQRMSREWFTRAMLAMLVSSAVVTVVTA